MKGDLAQDGRQNLEDEVTVGSDRVLTEQEGGRCHRTTRVTPQPPSSCGDTPGQRVGAWQLTAFWSL